MTDLLLFENIDEPGLATLDVYRRRGGYEMLRRALDMEPEDVHIREFECLGACDMAPMASVNGRYIGPLQPGDAEQIVEALKRGEQPLPGRGLGDDG